MTINQAHSIIAIDEKIEALSRFYIQLEIPETLQLIEELKAEKLKIYPDKETRTNSDWAVAE